MLDLHDLKNLPPISDQKLRERRERVCLLITGIFLGAMVMLNIIGITRFVRIGPLTLAVGVLPYPITFLCTDFISEFYGRRRATFVVWIGVLLNLFVIAVLWFGNLLPSLDFKTDLQRLDVVRRETVYADSDARKTPLIHPETQLPLKRVVVVDGAGETRPVESVQMKPVVDAAGAAMIDPGTGRPVVEPVDGATGVPLIEEQELYLRIFFSARGAVLASMLAYLAAQFCDVFLFHMWKRLTKGRHLWLRNNGSTMVSQLLDTVVVVLVTFWASITSGQIAVAAVVQLIWGAYLFKLVVAALDTIPFYLGANALSRYLRIDPTREYSADGVPINPGTGGMSGAR